MRHFNRFLMASLALLLFAGLAAAQQKPEQRARQITPLKVQIVLSEYDGTKKISSLPYTFTANAAADRGLARSVATHLRLGNRVPVVTGRQGKTVAQTQYVDMGTNIDCTARAMSEGTYLLRISIERSAIYAQNGKAESGGLEVESQQPIIRQFRVSDSLVLRNGQSNESMIATDPASGHVLRVSVTLHVVRSAP